ncbi:histone H1 [Teratosphaeria destructans]|uniref:Histone H1 n=1 Tax=Teratosphaeria destructans TaxID=418781 RepID=A0A9W7STP9_9PEZI|nr:histone H1 [Teratosphaeria destructans]
MAPKKSTTTKKTAGTAASHGSYMDMIKEAIINLKDRQGSSRQAIKKYVMANNDLGNATESAISSNLNRALLKGSENGTFTRPKGNSGPVKLAGPKPSATTTKAPAKAKASTAKTTKATTATTKKAPAKKTAAAAKKTTTTKKAPAKTATAVKTKTTKAKATAPAPAVEDKKTVVLTKTKSGRASKGPKQEEKAKVTKRKAPAKKATPKKTATPKTKA